MTRGTLGSFVSDMWVGLWQKKGTKISRLDVDWINFPTIMMFILSDFCIFYSMCSESQEYSGVYSMKAYRAHLQTVAIDHSSLYITVGAK